MLAAVREAFPEKHITSPPASQAFFKLLFSHCLSPCCLSAWSSAAYFGLYPSQACCLLKLQPFGTWYGRDLHWSSGEGFTGLGLMQVWHRKAVVPEYRDMGHGAKQAKYPVSRLTALSSCLCAYAEGQGREMASSQFFCPCRGNAISHRYSKKREQSLPLCL